MPAISNPAISNISLFRTIFPVPYHKSVFISNFSLLYPEIWLFYLKNLLFVCDDHQKNDIRENFGSIKSTKIALKSNFCFKIGLKCCKTGINGYLSFYVLCKGNTVC